MSLDRRVAKAQALTQSAACETCGGPPAPGEPTEYVVEWLGMGIWQDDPEPEDTHCSDCGRQLVIEVTWEEDREPMPEHVVSWIQNKRDEESAKELIADLDFPTTDE